MKTKMVGILAVLLLVAALVVGLAGVVLAAPDAQTWYLDDTLIGGSNYEMDKGTPDATESYVTIPHSGTPRQWYADEAATVDVPFPSGTWTGSLNFTTAPPVGTDKIRVEVGYMPGFAFYGFQDLTGDGSTKVFPFSISSAEFTVQEGDYLAIRVTNNYYVPATDIDVDTGGTDQSSIASPSTDPGYPVPELATILLSGAGLAALGGYIWLRRRRQHKVIFSG